MTYDTDRRSGFREWIGRRISSRALLDLEMTYTDFADQYLQTKDLLAGSIYEAEPEVFDFVCGFLRDDRDFYWMNVQKNGHLVKALNSYFRYLGLSLHLDGEKITPQQKQEFRKRQKETAPASPAGEKKTVNAFGFSVPSRKNPVLEEAVDHQRVTQVQAREEKRPVPAEKEKNAAEDPASGADAEEIREAAAEKAAEEIPVPEVREDFVPRSMQICMGDVLETGEAYYWEPNNTDRVFHMNMGIIGTMGTGKTQFTKSLMTQLALGGKDNFDGTKAPGLLIFDYKGDYNESKKDFVEAAHARVLKPYHLPFNPLALIETRTFRPLLPTHTANAFKDTISRVYHLGPKQQSILFKCIMDAYKMRGILPEKPATWKKTPPTLSLVNRLYQQDDTVTKKDSLSAAMEKLEMFEIFEKDPSKTVSLFDMVEGVVVIDLSGYDPDIQSLIVAITLNLFYSQMVATGSSSLKEHFRQVTRLILVDEADNFMSEDFPSLKKIMKEGREFGVGVVLATQSMKHFETTDNSYEDYILTWVVHNVSDLREKDVDFVFRVPPKGNREKELYNTIKKLEKFQSIVKVGNEEPVRIRDRAFWELYRDMKKQR